jgi:peptidyl-tRNA hydrolase
MPEGLLAAQTAHTGDAFMRNRVIDAFEREEPVQFSLMEIEWMKDPYITVLGVNNIEELMFIEKQAKDAGLPVFEWRDLLPSKILKCNIPDVKVAISIGPDDFDKIKAITGNLPLA